MPRFPRSYNETCFFHVITQGINKSYIFDKREDILYYIETINKLAEELDIKVIAYCIMNNHAHILIQSEKIETLSKYMHRLNTTYAVYYNRKYSRVGYIFRDRYKSEGIYSEEHLYNCIKYIYDNPVKAKICKLACEYPYSNYKDYPKEVNGNYVFLDADIDNEQVCKEVIENYILDNLLTIEELVKSECRLKELVHVLKGDYNVSLRQISKELGINREKIRVIYNMK